ncbi:MAG: acyl-CoA dehydrogenase family protein [Steroidobacteraceae bacterium]|nr:acyl-CoA/acyl-ACP dehydrogenase [Steroidobacteraceae bacterium]MBP7012654.1 acyl-CoA/acyl-ACP dehydrogenase [Steroidobacteraceae bacterium]
MNFQMTEEQGAIVEMASRLFADLCNDEAIQRFWSGNAAYDETTWQCLREAGLTALILPEVAGGSALGMTELCAVLECQGRHLAPVPLWSHQLAVAALAQFADATAARPDGSALADATRLATLSLEGLHGSRGLMLHAEPDAGGWRLHGRAIAVPLAEQAVVALLPARTPQGARLFAVDLAQAGVEKIGGRLTHHEPAADLVFAHLSLPAGAALDEDALGWLAPRVAACQGALQLGVTAEALKRVVAYTCERVQFGQPIAAFQAISQKCADCLIDVEALRSSLWQLVWRLDSGLDAVASAGVVKAWTCDTGHRVTHAAQHMHGGIGVDVSYPIHRYTYWSRAIEIAAGGVSVNLEALGQWLATPALTDADC